MSEIQENEQKAYHHDTEIKGPVQLLPSLGFFAQEPFMNVIENISSRARISKKQVGYILRQVSTEEELRNIVTPVQMRAYTEIQERNDSLGSLAYDVVRDAMLSATTQEDSGGLTNVKMCARIIKALTIQLTRYPKWPEYIATNFDRDVYRDNGEWKPTSPVNKLSIKLLPLSYGEWFYQDEQRQGRRGRQVLLGSEDIFSESSSLDTVRAVGKAPAFRTWRIRRNEGF